VVAPVRSLTIFSTPKCLQTSQEGRSARKIAAQAQRQSATAVLLHRAPNWPGITATGKTHVSQSIGGNINPPVK
jgi:hypothetical protein